MNAVNVCRFKVKFSSTGVLAQDAFRVSGTVLGTSTEGPVDGIKFVSYGPDAMELSKKILSGTEAIVVSRANVYDHDRVEFVIDSLDVIEK
jgi:hypothetical protein